MLSCRHATRLISDRLDRSLPGLSRLRLGLHLLTCRPCSHFARAAQWLHAHLAAAPLDVGLSEQARNRIQRALDEAGCE